MSKALSSYAEWEVQKVVDRRLKGNTGGLGFLAAQDYASAVAKKEQEKKNQK